MLDDSGGHDSESQKHVGGDPRLAEPSGEQGMAGELIDSFRNMPGDQPVGEDRPTKTDLERDPSA